MAPPPPPPPPPSYNPTGVQYHNIPVFKFANGTTLQDVKVAFRSYNPSSTAGTVLIPTCFSGRINSTLTFTHYPNDALARYHVVVAAMLGNGESSSPSNKSFFPEPGQLHYEDVIHAHHHMLTSGLNVRSLEAVVGFSMGGQQAYHWAIMYPAYVKRIVAICTSAQTSPHNYAFLEGPIAALVNSLDYAAWKQIKSRNSVGEKLSQSMGALKPKNGLIGFGRAYSAWLTSAEWFRERHWKTTLGFDSVEAWIKSQGDGKLDWDADDLLVTARMWQMGDIGKTAKGEVTQLGWECAKHGDDEHDSDADLVAALKNITCPVLLMPNRTDQYFRPMESEREAKNLRHGRLAIIESVWGHTSGGGLCADDTEFMNAMIGEFLNEI